MHTHVLTMFIHLSHSLLMNGGNEALKTFVDLITCYFVKVQQVCNRDQDNARKVFKFIMSVCSTGFCYSLGAIPYMLGNVLLIIANVSETTKRL